MSAGKVVGVAKLPLKLKRQAVKEKKKKRKKRGAGAEAILQNHNHFDSAAPATQQAPSCFAAAVARRCLRSHCGPECQRGGEPYDGVQSTIVPIKLCISGECGASRFKLKAEETKRSMCSLMMREEQSGGAHAHASGGSDDLLVPLHLHGRRPQLLLLHTLVAYSQSIFNTSI